MLSRLPRLLVAGSGSGSGKTTLACALLLALKRRGLAPAAFKCGPDYIDPMFHSRVLGVKSRNLDIFMCGEERVKSLLAENAGGHGLALIEGVMGLYDGLGAGEYGSSNHLAALTGTPTLLVLNTRGKSLSLAAELSGYLNFLPNNVSGVLFSQTSEKMYNVYSNMVMERLGLPAYGYLPPLPEAAFASRHLGLVTPMELPGLEAKLELLAQACEDCVDVEGLLALAGSAPELEYEPLAVEPLFAPGAGPLIAVARDKAFCFYYEDNFELLRRLGARLAFFSPLGDSALPQGAAGLLLGGGYPEEHARALAMNRPMLESVRRAGEGGMPIMAECGGFMYLCRELADKSGGRHQMAALIDSACRVTEKPGNFGYITLTSGGGNFLCPAGQSLRGHEFHYSEADEPGAAFTARKAGGAGWPCIHASAAPTASGARRIFAGYPHLHFWGQPELAASFVKACAEYAGGR